MLSRVFQKKSVTSDNLLNRHQSPTKIKSNQTIYEEIKQVVRDENKDEENKIKEEDKDWKDITEKLNHPPYKKQHRKILEKLNEEDTYAILHHSVLANKLHIFKQLIEDYKCNVNLLGYGGQTPLHLAASSIDIAEDKEKAVNCSPKSNDSILLYLLRHNDTNIYMQDNHKRTALHYAIIYDRVANAKAIIDTDQFKQKHDLIKKKSILNLRDAQGALPIHYACQFGNKQILALFENGFNQWRNEKTFDEKQPLEIAAENGYLKTVKKLLTKPPRQLSIAALAYAAVRSKNDGTVKFLQEEPFPPQEGPFSFPPYIFHAACRERHGHYSISALTITNIELQKVDPDGFTPLMVAVKHRRVECVKALLDTGECDEKVFMVRSKSLKCSVFHICAEIQHEEINNILFKALKNVEKKRCILTQRNTMGDTPLHICAKKGNKDMCQELLNLYGTFPRSNPGNTPIWLIENYDKLTPFQEAVLNNQLPIVEIMLNLIPPIKRRIDMICAIDADRCTSLHIAASKGNADIVNLLIENGLDVNALDKDNNTPLHYAVSWEDDNKNNERARIDCIDLLILNNADVDACNICQETPLHNASRYGSFKLVESLLNHNADPLLITINGFNCLEVAIEEKNEEVVKYFIEHPQIFQLMRNAQRSGTKFLIIDNYLANTPMRKLIEHMPEMAFLMLEKCTIDIGAAKTVLERKIYNYEFLEDQYFIHSWIKENFIDERGRKIHDKDKKIGDAYTIDYRIIVENHPLFLMAKHNQMKLMAHPLSKSLANNIFYTCGLWMFLLFFIMYSVFIGLFTVIAVRINHPQAYYNATNITFDSSLCELVSRAIEKNPNSSGIKTSVDRVLRPWFTRYLILLLMKNAWIIAAFTQVHVKKSLTFIFEIGSILLSFFFLWDYEYQKNVTMRCPTQWQYGAFGLFVGYLGLLYYIQYIPIIGIYVIMLKIVVIRFIFFLPVLTCLFIGFGVAFYMLFQYQDAFNNFRTRALSQMVIMMTGELNFSDNMFDKDDLNKPYYKISYFMFILFAIGVVILVSNLLISLAVGEIMPLMHRAQGAQLDMKFELIADYEILRLQFFWFFRGHFANRSRLYKFLDMKKIPFLETIKKYIAHWFIFTTYIDEEIFQSYNENEDKGDKQISMLVEIKEEMCNSNRLNKTFKQLSHHIPNKRNNKKH